MIPKRPYRAGAPRRARSSAVASNSAGQRRSRWRFPLGVAAASSAMFAGVYFSDELPEAATATVQAAADIDRDRAPQPGDYWSRCSEARAAGVAPLHVGEPGYREGLDRDRDGIACEPYQGR